MSYTIGDGIPLPEFPFEQPREHARPDPANVIPILGMVLSTLSLGTMIVLYLNLPAESHANWVAPLPFAFLGVGFIVFYFLHLKTGR